MKTDHPGRGFLVALGTMAGLLPTVIDKLTPDGKVPDTDSLENTLSSLLGKLA